MDQLATLIASIEGFLVQSAHDTMPADLLILEIGDDTAKDFDALNRAKATGRASGFFITSKSTNPEVLIQALRLGVKEFIPQPLNEGDVRKALLRFRDGSEPTPAAPKGPRRKGQILNILGVKGGVGTTTIAVNLADSLAGLGGAPAVAIIDMNRLFGEIPLFLSLEHVLNWFDVSKNIDRLDATYLTGILYRHRSGLRVLPPPDRVDDKYTVTPQVVESLLRLMRTMFDYVIIDSGQAVDDISKTIRPSGVTSVAASCCAIDALPQPIMVFPFGRRCAEPCVAAKASGVRRYSQTIVAVFAVWSSAYSTAREYCGFFLKPLSNRSRFPLGSKLGEWGNEK
jgi:pilus assembly protein CpaE